MTTDKRARQKENRANRVAAAEAAAAKARRQSRIMTYGGLLVVGVVAVLVVAVLLRDDDPDTTDAGGTVEGFDDGTGVDQTNDTLAPTTTVDLGPGWDEDSTTPCPPTDGSGDRVLAFDGLPPLCIDPEGQYTATLDTTAGEFTIELDAARAPATVNSFVFLSRYRYYEGVSFHRIIPGFVIQGGDAVGDPPGTGGPGYAFPDELPQEGEYEIGSVAMANSGPNTNGSQFFVVTGESGAALPPDYNLFGTVTAGLDVVSDIESVGTASGAPSEDIVINTVTITER